MEKVLDRQEERSQRLLERSSRPLFLVSSVEKDAFLREGLPGSFSTQIDFSGGHQLHLFGLVDKNLPECPILDMKYWCTFSDEKLGFIDVMVEMCIGRNDQTLGQLNFREIESFLRDLNHVPAFPNNGAAVLPIFSKIVEGLKKAIEESRGRRPGQKESPTISGDYQKQEKPIFNPSLEGAFRELPLSKKYIFVNQVIEQHIRPFLYRDYGDIECLLIDGNMIVVEYLGACAQCTKSLTSTMDYIQAVLRLELDEAAIMVVTDS